MVKNQLAKQGHGFNPWLGDYLEKGMATCSSILAWKIPWTGGVHIVGGSQRVRHDWATHTLSQLSSTIFSLGRQSQPLINHIIVRRKKLFFTVWVFMTFSTFWLVMKLSGLVKVKVQVTQLCLTPCDPMHCTVHGILQARILEWVAFPFSTWASALSQKTMYLWVICCLLLQWNIFYRAELLINWPRNLVIMTWLIVFYCYHNNCTLTVIPDSPQHFSKVFTLNDVPMCALLETFGLCLWSKPRGTIWHVALSYKSQIRGF